MPLTHPTRQEENPAPAKSAATEQKMPAAAPAPKPVQSAAPPGVRPSPRAGAASQTSEAAYRAPVLPPPDANVCQDRRGSAYETGVDCGGICRPCQIDQRCAKAQDCVSGLCQAGSCRERIHQPGDPIPPGYRLEKSQRDRASSARTAGLGFFVLSLHQCTVGTIGPFLALRAPGRPLATLEQSTRLRSGGCCATHQSIAGGRRRASDRRRAHVARRDIEQGGATVAHRAETARQQAEAYGSGVSAD